LFALLAATALLSSCYKFEGDQTVPAYIRTDSIGLTTNYQENGTNSHYIKDVWVYVDDVLLGAYELPAVLPALYQGQHKLTIKPGIKINGISSTRAPYPFYNPIIYEDFNFIPDSVFNLGIPTTEYAENLNFMWMEDFETPGLSITETSASDTNIVRTQPAGNPEAFLSEYSRRSGVIHLTTDARIYSASSLNSFPIPKQGSPTLLEVNFKSDNYFNVGIIIQENSTYIKIPLVILNHSEQWNKIYINIGPNLSLHPNATDFKIFFETSLESDKNSAVIYLDNIKLINRPY
jgi:hypothetical protein